MVEVLKFWILFFKIEELAFLKPTIYMYKFIIKKFRIDRLIEYLTDNNLLFAKYYKFYLFKKHAKKKSILIYNMGKVGSMTVYNSLKDQLDNFSLYHVHWLDKKNLDKDARFLKKFNKELRRNNIVKNNIFDYIVRGYYINSKINNGYKNFKIYTLTRDPIARNVSSFFQNIDTFFCYDIRQRLTESSEDKVVEELIDLFLNEFIINNEINFFDASPVTWFDKELKSVFNIDIFKTDFPKEKGYKIYRNNNISVLLIRLEDLNRCFAEASYKLLGEEVTIVDSKNKASDKAYISVYKKFKEKIIFPDWYFDRMYESRYAKHFYTDHEIITFKNKWSK